MPTKNPRQPILLVGVGELGGLVLEILARIPGVPPIVATDTNDDWGLRKTNSAIEGASYMGLYPDISFRKIDLLDVDRTASLINDVRPSVVFNGTTLQSWWVVNELPTEVRNKLYRDKCGLGPWAAMHLALTSKLMQAVKQAGVDTHVVNSSYPDVTNPSLAKVGLAPTVGIGNGDLIVPYVQKTASELLGVPMRNVSAQMVVHHYHAYTWCRAGNGTHAPHYVKVYVGSEDVTDRLGTIEEFVAQLPKHAVRPAGRHGQFVVAASSVKNIMAIVNDTGELTHAPGPEGLEGGYPVRLSRSGAEIVPPPGLTKQDARNINLKAQKYDGIEEIRDNGDVVFTAESQQTFKEMLGLDHTHVSVATAFEQATDLRKRFLEFARSHGVNV